MGPGSEALLVVQLLAARQPPHTLCAQRNTAQGGVFLGCVARKPRWWWRGSCSPGVDFRTRAKQQRQQTPAFGSRAEARTMACVPRMNSQDTSGGNGFSKASFHADGAAPRFIAQIREVEFTK